MKRRTTREIVSEQVVAVWNALTTPIPFGPLRTRLRKIGMSWWGRTPIAYQGTEINYNLARSLYRNDGDSALGSGFCKPIVDLQVGFMGLPTASTENAQLDDFLNETMHVYWADELQQMFRDSMRDSKTIVRIAKPDVFDPLMTLEESEACTLEIIAPEKVEIERNPRNKRIIERALIRHRMVFVIDGGSIDEGRDPQVEEHDVLEIITREDYRFYDLTTSLWLSDMSAPNKWGFVPLLEVYNEWDAALEGGQSDFESVLPFIKALHDLLAQGLQAHKYHSIPRVLFKIDDIESFIKNNFPDAWDEATGMVKPGAAIEIRGNEVVFVQKEEDVGFVEAQSVLGDTKQLAEFIIDCICIASQTPEWAFMRTESGTASSDRNAQTVPWVRKIMRKRNSFQKYVQELLKMLQVINGGIPYRPKITWDFIRSDDQLVLMQALQQLIMGLEVAKQSGEISDETYREMIRQFIPFMKNPQQEAKDAKRNTQTAIAGGNGNAPALAGGPQGDNE